MRRLNLFLTASAAYLAFGSPAEAAPIVAAVTAVTSAISAFAASSWVGALIVGIGKSLVVGLLNQVIGKLTQKKQRQTPVGIVLETKMGDDLPISFLAGRTATAGKRRYWGTWGAAENTPNAYFVDVLEISHLPSSAGPRGLASLWVADKLCTVLWDEPHPDGRGYPVSEFRGNDVDYLWVKYLDGSQTAADPYLLASFGNHPDRPYLPTMVGRGKQAVIVTARLNQTYFGSGNPAILAEPVPMPLYDVSKDSSAGGDGPQRWNDKSTWQPSANAALLIYNTIRGVTDHAGEWLYGGQAVSAYRLPASNWMAGANEAARSIGGDPQFRAGLEIDVDREPLDAIDDYRLACNGRLAHVDGRLKLLVGAPGGAVWHFDDAMVIVSDPQELDPFPSLSDTHNTITASYPEPGDRWVMKDAPEYSVAAYVADDRRWLTHAVPMRAVSWSKQVQAIQKTLIEDGRRFRVHQLTLPPIARLLEPGDVIGWTSEHNGYGDKLFVIEKITRLKGSLQRVTIKEIDPSDYDPPSYAIPPTLGIVGPAVVPPQPMYGWRAEKATIKDGDGRPRRPSILIGCAPDQDDVRAVWVQVRLASTGQIVFDSSATAYAPPYEWILNGTFLPATAYEASGQFIPYSNRATERSAWIPVTTDNIRLTAGLDFDPYAGVIGMDSLGEDVAALQRWVGAGIRDMRDLVEEIGVRVAEATLSNGVDRQEIRQQITSTFGSARSEYKSLAETLAAADLALARRIETLDTTFGGYRTSVNSQLVALSSADEALGLAITNITSELHNPATGLPATANAVSGLTTRVNSHDGNLAAVAELMTGLQSQIGDVSASVNIRATAGVDAGGGYTRYGIQVKAEGGDWSSQAGLYLQTRPGWPSQIVLDAQQLFFGDFSTGAILNPLVYSGGKWRSQAQDIGLVTAGVISLGNGRLLIDENGIVGTVG